MDQEISRDVVEEPFFRWALMEIDPLGEGWFQKNQEKLSTGEDDVQEKPSK